MYVCVYIFNIYMPCSMLTVLVYSSACQQRPIALRVGAYKSAKVTWVFLLPAVSSQQSAVAAATTPTELSIKSKFRWVREKCKATRWQTHAHTHTPTHAHCVSLAEQCKSPQMIPNQRMLRMRRLSVGFYDHQQPMRHNEAGTAANVPHTCRLHFGVGARWFWLVAADSGQRPGAVEAAEAVEQWSWCKNIYKN